MIEIGWHYCHPNLYLRHSIIKILYNEKTIITPYLNLKKEDRRRMQEEDEKKD